MEEATFVGGSLTPDYHCVEFGHVIVVGFEVNIMQGFVCYGLHIAAKERITQSAHCKMEML